MNTKVIPFSEWDDHWWSITHRYLWETAAVIDVLIWRIWADPDYGRGHIDDLGNR